jgi:hypothetical protein
MNDISQIKSIDIEKYSVEKINIGSYIIIINENMIMHF